MTWKDAVGLALEDREEGYNFLYQQTYQKSYYVALKYMKQEEEAADVLQDAYIKAFQNLDQLQEPDKFPGWFSRIVASRALDELRKKKAVLFSQMQTEDSEEVSMEELLVDERVENRPELAMDREETSRLVQEMIAGLSDEQRMCVMMFYIEQMSVKNIAEVTGVSENTVKSRLKYGRKNIEEKVLELERKGTKLYGITPFPFFLYFLLRDTYSAGVFQIPLQNILQAAGIATFHGAGVGNGAGSGTGVGSGAGMGTAASAAAKTSSVAVGKIIAGVIAGIVVTAGVTTAVVSLAGRQPEKPVAADTIEERKEEPVVEVETETETETETQTETETETETQETEAATEREAGFVSIEEMPFEIETETETESSDQTETETETEQKIESPKVEQTFRFFQVEKKYAVSKRDDVYLYEKKNTKSDKVGKINALGVLHILEEDDDGEAMTY